MAAASLPVLRYTFDINALHTTGSVSRYILPTDGMWRSHLPLEPATMIN